MRRARRTNQAAHEARPATLERIRPIVVRALKLIRTLAYVALLAAAGAAFCAYWAASRVDEQIRAAFEAKCRERYQGLAVHVQGARRIEGKGIEIRGVSILAPHGSVDEAQLFQCDELFIVCNTGLAELAAGRLDTQKVILRRPKVRMAREADGAWSAAQLWPPPDFSDDDPTVTVEDGVVEIIDAAARHVLRDLRLTIGPTPRGAGQPAPPPGELRIEGTAATEHCPCATFSGLIHPPTGAFRLSGSLDDLEVSPRLAARLPDADASRSWQPADYLGRVQATFELGRQNGQEPPWFVVSGNLTGGHVDDPRLPYPIVEVQGLFYADRQTWRVEEVSGRCGRSRLRLWCSQEQWAEQGPLTLRLQAEEFVLERRLAEFLPANLREVWTKFSPAGLVDADVTLRIADGEIQPEAVVQCRDASFAFYRFPYRIQHAVGKIRYQERRLTASVTGSASGRAVQVETDVVRPDDDGPGWVEVRSRHAILIDEPLIDALPEKARRVVRSLSPRGEASFVARFDRRVEGEDWAKRIDLTLRGCAIKYERFPYSIDQIGGSVHWDGGVWRLRDLAGRNGNTYIECQGDWTSGDDDDNSTLALRFLASSVALDDELRGALPEPTRRVWESVRPRGVLDQLEAEVRYATADHRLAIDVRLQQWPKERLVEGRGVTLEPIWFPYTLEDVTGSVAYRDGQITLESLRAAHGRAALSLEGVCNVFDDGRWQAQISRLSADRLSCDLDLLRALPKPLAKVAEKLQPTGPLSLAGSLRFSGRQGDKGPPTAEWDLSLDLENGALRCGPKFEHIHGGARLVGGADANGFLCRGELAVDSAMIEGVQLTGISGPLLIDPRQASFGAWTRTTADAKAPPRLTARVLDGELGLNGRIVFENDPQFMLHAQLADASLARMSAELTSATKRISGRASGELQLAGAFRGRHTWQGNGVIRLTDANIYELPVMVALLKLLSIKPPDTSAFAAGDIAFRLHGDHVYFHQIDFHGDAISLKGKGDMNWRREIQLQFYTMVGRDETRFPLFSVLGEASRQLLLIHVDGTLDEPQVRREAFPGLNETLNQVFPEAAARRPAARSLPAILSK